MYSVHFLKPALKELERLDRTAAKRIVDRLEWLSINLDSTKLSPLKGDPAGLYKLREGSYRIFFEVLRTDRIIMIHAIGHRHNVYKKR
ncbi:MAG TPA: type II toxin-antitoxin system RelE/ParE family toxin [Bacteroidota bacterium]|nr:type II toxin-antitoxin system RelE/ParE family toxin [Bacteroidota bacterium]